MDILRFECGKNVKKLGNKPFLINPLIFFLWCVIPLELACVEQLLLEILEWRPHRVGSSRTTIVPWVSVQAN